VNAIDSAPQTLSEMFLVLLEDRFPWLGTDDPADGADTVEQLSELHQSLLERRSAMQSERSGTRPVLAQHHRPSAGTDAR
jgi:hypothetical protein